MNGKTENLNKLKTIYKTIFFIIFTVLLTSCKENYKTQMTLTTNKTDSLEIGLSGSWGDAKIDWGNGTTITSDDLCSLPIDFKNSYSDRINHKITINGSKLNTIKGLFCFNNQITSLNISNCPKLETLEVLKNKLIYIDVKKNTELKVLNCTSNKLKSLDVSSNTLLEHLSCENNQLGSLDLTKNKKILSVFLRSNQLNITQLNLLFETLHSNKILDKTIYIGGNPGTEKCNKSIAINKGWIVDIEPAEFK
jgi:hypothetical protein